MKRITWVLWSVLMLSACRSEEVALTLVYQSSQCGNPMTGVTLLRDQGQFDAVFGSASTGRPIPQIDFNSHMAVLVAMGMKPNSAYGLELMETVGQVVDDVLIVPVVQRGPEPGMMYAQVMTSPCMILTLDRDEVILSARLP